MNNLKLIIAPDPDDPDATEIFVDGEVDGQNYRFLLDTGAATSEITFDDVTSGYPPLKTKKSSGAFASSEREIIEVGSIRLGPISKDNCRIARKSKGERSRYNLIGMDILKDYSCQFLFDVGQMCVNLPVTEGTKIKFQELFLGKKFHPYIPVIFGSLRANTVWDTGAGITVVDQTFIDRNPKLFSLIGSSTGTDSTGTSQKTPIYLMGASVIGQSHFLPHKVAGVDLSHVNSTTEVPMDMVLGYSTLGQANWIFDFPNKRWAILKMHT